MGTGEASRGKWEWEREGKGGKGKGAYATAIRAIALVAYGAFTHDSAVSVGGFVRDDIAGAAAAVGDAGVGHCFVMVWCEFDLFREGMRG